MDEIKKIIDLLLPQQTHFDALAVGVIDFKTAQVDIIGHNHLYFDLASVTKVLGHSALYYLKPENFDKDMSLLLNHRAGLPAWGLLPNPGWQEIINSYSVKESETLYSDYSAMRVSLEYEKRFKKTVPQELESLWDMEVLFWRDLPIKAMSPVTGHRHQKAICKEVHDPNAWVIDQWCGHAGLFGTAKGVCQTLLNLQKKTDFINKVKTSWGEHNHRFIQGWDRVENPANTLAGKGCSKHTFGHLGFTGTSVWIDADKMKGHVILSNATRDGWYLKDGLNEIRRAIGEMVWK
ncbi:MAG: serine hydrolase [Bacteriovoracaceae bacterium]|nr:serine hydrolase [Bacteriovoracaceae bacterium]